MSTTEVTTTTQQSISDYFTKHANETASKLWVGTLMKFTKGDFVAGQNNKDVPLGSRFVAMMPGLMVGWLKWSDGHPVDNAMGLVSEGFTIAKRDTLGDNDKSQWEVDPNGRQKDPWARGNYLILVDAKSEEVYTFASGSKGGESAIGELCRAYGGHVKMYPTQVPVIEIGAGSYRNTTYRTDVDVPTFKIVDWVEEAAYMALVKAGTAVAEEAGPATKRIAEKPKAKNANGRKGSKVRFARN
jgi:hypothetical protein